MKAMRFLFLIAFLAFLVAPVAAVRADPGSPWSEILNPDGTIPADNPFAPWIEELYNRGVVYLKLNLGPQAEKSFWAVLNVQPTHALAAKALGEVRHGEMTKDQCAEYAVETLRQAADAGWSPTPEVFNSDSFAALAGHPGLAGLVRH